MRRIDTFTCFDAIWLNFLAIELIVM